MESIMNNIMIASFILWSLYTECLSVRFQVSSVPSVSVVLGSDVLLPCRLAPEKNGEKMEIRWFKKIYRPYAHLYINRKDDYTAQMPQFADRTELLKENITRGIFPLKIRNVTAQDSGEYHCYVESSDHHGMATVQLQVTAIGTVPVISSITNDAVSCESRDWHPKPHLTWTDNEGNKINCSMMKVFRDENNLYNILGIIQQPNASNVTCTVSNSINHSNDSRQIRGLDHSQSSRGTHSHVYLIGASFILICFGCICFLLRSLGALQRKYGALQRKYEALLGTQPKPANGTPHTEAHSPV
ncbi:selection and upkeep of intraepithelial T-cells protein 2 isoform X1 [Xenopus tropicalis]|uniref:Selection and upkeep of intraepithelial T-cells protein 2 isoform X1 n=1 Tax=Xenopus tropicalis TaxID=8364 RepID=A0A8J1IQN8_XENTR|nr:selection and upkeep of intraepithelial T-cells protein 2 isoform X1 [Xenopus tropicalis]XP_031747050.1 selection and upkeep of intraepithelial T-cells protein 2 isoform X1 [Xenopus tropicalis]|eukprot:XP_004918988.1 PREDICTED: selection and upkeep of intraepithelial T-cells protein 2-like isoform X1 [Xenopus tropicalis]